MAMIEYDEYKQKLTAMGPELDKLAAALDMDRARAELKDLQAQTEQEGFWNDLATSQKVSQQIKRLENKVHAFDKLRQDWEDATVLCEMGQEADDPELLPELDDDSEIEIRPEDIEMQACRSSGAGGQHINKTSSAVRLTHLPTGIVVFCQTERSQFQNRDNAMKMLRAKLAELKLQQHAEKISDLKGVQMKIEWGSQIRSYVFMPYTLAKDTRTGYEMGNIQAVMDGDIDGFINAYLTAAANGEIKK